MNKSQSQHSERFDVTEEVADRLYGILTECDDERGYGFITPSNGEPKVFQQIKLLLPTAELSSGSESVECSDFQFHYTRKIPIFYVRFHRLKITILLTSP